MAIEVRLLYGGIKKRKRRRRRRRCDIRVSLLD